MGKTRAPPLSNWLLCMNRPLAHMPFRVLATRRSIENIDRTSPYKLTFEQRSCQKS